MPRYKKWHNLKGSQRKPLVSRVVSESGSKKHSYKFRGKSFLMSKMDRLDVAFVSFRLILFVTLIFFMEKSVATDTLTLAQELSIEQTLNSADGTFELGFFTSNNSTKRYIGIWYKNIDYTKPVWVANRENPLNASDASSVLTIASDGNLKILDGTRKPVWSTNVTSNPNNTIAVFSDKGELSLKDNVSGTILWESFKMPSDSLIAGIRVGVNNQTGEEYNLTSWRTEDDPSPGEFVSGLTMDSPPQNIVWKNGQPHWRSGPWDGSQFIGLSQTNTGYSNGFIITQEIEQGSVFASYTPPSTSQIMVEFVAPDGNLKFTRWDVETRAGGVKFQSIEVFCDVYNSCGPFGVCNRQKATCECLKGFIPNSEQEWKKGNWTRGCMRRTDLECAKNTSMLSKTDSDGFTELKNMKAPDRYLYLFNVNSSDCKSRCTSDCLCIAYAYVAGIGCLTWAGDLLDMQKFAISGTGTDVYLRLAQSELDEGKKNIELVAILVSIFGVLFLGAFMYGYYRCIQNRKALKRRRILQMDLSDKMAPLNGIPLQDMWGPQAAQQDSSDLLPMLDFATLSVATNNFNESNKLGAGGFGPVYKGKLEDGQEIAVKRLSIHSGQGAVEFKNEILLISKLQHRNLVRLLGYCIKGDEKLLIYEYLKNKSLDTFLFDIRMGLQLNWEKRFSIIEGIARGLLYLHRDSCLRIIHRDLKPSNILLDDNMNPKISDFGLARAFDVTQELANTHRVVGTFGYMSPEYAMGGLLSEKSDVFSFGVMILEIISGEKNTSFLYEEKYLNLLGYAWGLWNEDKSQDFMNKELPDKCSSEDFTKFMQIGLLCVQDHVIDRPTMSAVVLMLTGDTNIPQPKQPTFYQGLMYSDLRSQFKKLSMNAVSLTNIVGR